MFSGTAKAAVETLLSFRVSGEIRERPVTKGMALKAGDLIARLDPTDYELQVKQNEAALAQSEASLEQANADYERVRQLYESQNASKSELDSAQAAYKLARASHDGSLKGLELAIQQLEYCTLKAPVDGAVASVSAEAHQTVSAGQTIATMTSGDTIEMELGIPETLIGYVSVGQECTVSFDALPGQTIKARVSEVGIQANTSSTYPVTLSLIDAPAAIRFGMVGEATFQFKPMTGRDAIIIPRVAVVPTADGGHYIWIYDPNTSAVKKRMIEIGEVTTEGLMVYDGLNPGEVVVVRGVHQLSDGMKVKLLEE
ncbi:MAG: efflux RND transporter periplasmic adaptor subunit [Spartobacteria bacterium]|nr:efflux RND transporter periplasmic adaptor subunit [Spartobacteria bacterium]